MDPVQEEMQSYTDSVVRKESEQVLDLVTIYKGKNDPGKRTYRYERETDA